MLGVVRGSHEHVGHRVEVAVVLAVREQEVHPDIGRHGLERLREHEQHRRARGTVVGAGDRRGALGGVGPLLRDRPRVPVRDVEDARGRAAVELREDIAHRQDLPIGRAVLESLFDDRIGERRHGGDDPVARRDVARGPRDARAEVELGLHQRECFGAIELHEGDVRRRISTGGQG